jgi:hypothetical protein
LKNVNQKLSISNEAINQKTPAKTGVCATKPNWIIMILKGTIPWRGIVGISHTIDYAAWQVLISIGYEVILSQYQDGATQLTLDDFESDCRNYVTCV